MCLVRLCTGCHQICEMKNRSGNFRARRVIYSVRNSAQDNVLKYIVGEQMCLVIMISKIIKCEEMCLVIMISKIINCEEMCLVIMISKIIKFEEYFWNILRAGIIRLGDLPMFQRQRRGPLYLLCH